jgi:hypothetical protein
MMLGVAEIQVPEIEHREALAVDQGSGSARGHIRHPSKCYSKFAMSTGGMTSAGTNPRTRP